MTDTNSSIANLIDQINELCGQYDKLGDIGGLVYAAEFVFENNANREHAIKHMSFIPDETVLEAFDDVEKFIFRENAAALEGITDFFNGIIDFIKRMLSIPMKLLNQLADYGIQILEKFNLNFVGNSKRSGGGSSSSSGSSSSKEVLEVTKLILNFGERFDDKKVKEYFDKGTLAYNITDTAFNGSLGFSKTAALLKAKDLNSIYNAARVITENTSAEIKDGLNTTADWVNDTIAKYNSFVDGYIDAPIEEAETKDQNQRLSYLQRAISLATESMHDVKKDINTYLANTKLTDASTPVKNGVTVRYSHSSAVPLQMAVRYENRGRIDHLPTSVNFVAGVPNVWMNTLGVKDEVVEFELKDIDRDLLNDFLSNSESLIKGNDRVIKELRTIKKTSDDAVKRINAIIEPVKNHVAKMPEGDDIQAALKKVTKVSQHEAYNIKTIFDFSAKYTQGSIKAYTGINLLHRTLNSLARFINKKKP